MGFDRSERVRWLCEGIMRYIESLRGAASKEIAFDDIWRQVSKSVDSAVLIIGFFNDASDAAYQTYEEASKMLLYLTSAVFASFIFLNASVSEKNNCISIFVKVRLIFSVRSIVRKCSTTCSVCCGHDLVKTCEWRELP